MLEGGRCELVTVVGEPGVGKSRLVAEFVAGLDARVVAGRCLSYGEGITYFPVVEVIKQLGTPPGRSGGCGGARGRCSGRATRATSPDEIAWAFRKLLEQAAPLVVVFDDIQWGEETFLDLVEQVALLSAGAPLLLLCLARPELGDAPPASGRSPCGSSRSRRGGGRGAAARPRSRPGCASGSRAPPAATRSS